MAIVIEKQDGSQDLEKLKSVFPRFGIDYYKCSIGPIFNVFCFICEKEQYLKEKWEDIVSYLASDFQTDFETDFERWNLYVLFFIKEACSLDLKYEIENDKFSSRKVVLDNYDIEKRDYRLVIEEEIFDLDITLSKMSTNENDNIISKESVILNLINASGNTLNSDGRLKTKVLGEFYDKLFKTYNDEV